jgi:hypothetical protein
MQIYNLAKKYNELALWAVGWMVIRSNFTHIIMLLLLAILNILQIITIIIIIVMYIIIIIVIIIFLQRTYYLYTDSVYNKLSDFPKNFALSLCP